MKGLFAKNFKTVILDGSDSDVVNTITCAIDIVTKERYGSSICRDFNGTLPTAKIVETRTDKKTYRKICGMIERSYPGLCIFSASVQKHRRRL